MRVRALGPQVTIYDEEGNIIEEIPPRPPEDPDEEVRVINIVDFEDRLMGIDPDAKPDFFIDLDALVDFEEYPEYKVRLLKVFMGNDTFIATMLCCAVMFGAMLLGYHIADDFIWG